ncbi:MAG: spore coat U domain-containing protein [Thermoanaerobaculia bacterium]
MKKTLIPIAIIFTLVAFAPAAFAGSAPGTLTVNASVAANCTISAATLNFGAYDPVVTNDSANLDAQTTMAVACTKGVTPKITAALGGAITNGGDTLNYLLFSNTGRTTTFVSPGFSMPAAAGKAPQTLTIYGRIAGGQDVGAGAFTGTTTMTVNF